MTQCLDNMKLANLLMIEDDRDNEWVLLFESMNREAEGLGICCHEMSLAPYPGATSATFTPPTLHRYWALRRLSTVC